MKNRKLVPLIVLTLLLAACLGGRRSRNSRGGPVQVEVHNNNWADVVVYALVNSRSLRIGDVTTGRVGRFKLPPDIDPTIRDFRIRIDPIGPRSNFVTQSISAGPGQTIYVTVENDLSLSSYVVR